jgi:hypothetical protein
LVALCCVGLGWAGRVDAPVKCFECVEWVGVCVDGSRYVPGWQQVCAWLAAGMCLAGSRYVSVVSQERLAGAELPLCWDELGDCVGWWVGWWVDVCLAGRTRQQGLLRMRSGVLLAGGEGS